MTAPRRYLSNDDQRHRPHDRGTCVCGAEIVHFDPDLDGYVGEGCERYGVFPRLRVDQRDSFSQQSLDLAALERSTR